MKFMPTTALTSITLIKILVPCCIGLILALSGYAPITQTGFSFINFYYLLFLISIWLIILFKLESMFWKRCLRSLIYKMDQIEDIHQRQFARVWVSLNMKMSSQTPQAPLSILLGGDVEEQHFWDSVAEYFTHI